MLEKDNLHKADGNNEENIETSSNKDSKDTGVKFTDDPQVETKNVADTKTLESDNNPEKIVEDLSIEADNLVVASNSTNGENEENNFSINSTTKELSEKSENVPKTIDADLENVTDNLPDTDKEVEAKADDPIPTSIKDEIEINNNPENIIDKLGKEPDNLVEPENNSLVETKTESENLKSSVKDNTDSVYSKTDTPSVNDSQEEVTTSKSDSEKENIQEHVDEIEESNAEDAEDSSNEERHTIESKDYSTLTMAQLNSEFDKLLKNQKIQTIRKQVDEIRSEFKSKFDALLDEKKEEYVSGGGNEIDFYYSSPDKKRFNEIYKTYKSQLNAYYKDLEKNLKDNLAKRLEIIEEIKGLINVEENINTTYRQFKDLQEQWRNAGPIPRDKYNNTWNTYHHHVEIFYDFLHLNRDLRDMDFKHNLDQKHKIIERAEELAEDDNINRAFRELQVLHKMWKEELGPVAKEFRDDIWNRFSAATKKIHDKRQAYYADQDKAYEANLERKEKIIADIEKIASEESNAHQAWQKNIKAVEALRQDFFNAGRVPKKVNEPTWAKFKAAVRNFNKKKNIFYKNLKQSQYDNLKKKMELIKIAEENMDSDDFSAVTPLMKKIQSDWKKIGHVPRKDSDKIWKKFKNACNQYFDKLHAKRKEDNKELYEAFDNKVKVLDKLKELKLDAKGPEANRKKIEKFVEDWKELGEVPPNKRYIEGKFNKAVNDLYDKLKMDKQDIEMIKYENKLDHLSKPEGTGLLDNEQNFIKKKIDELKGEINQLENNMQFFSNVDENNPLVKDVVKNLNRHKSDLQLWEDKLGKLKKMY